MAAPGNVVVAIDGDDDDVGVFVLSKGINLALSIASEFKGQIPVFLNPFFIVATLIDLSKDYLNIAVKFVLFMFW